MLKMADVVAFLSAVSSGFFSYVVFAVVSLVSDMVAEF